MIRVENVSFKYKNSENKILDNLNFSVMDGEIIAIVGQNGSGKSTIGKLIAGIIKLKEGNIVIDDLNIRKNKKQKIIQDKVGIVFQNPENQIIFNNIYDELSFSLKGLEKTEVENRIQNSLEQVGMLKYKNEDLYSLSLGQKQRIMIAEVLAKRPKYIIFDEPTTMIDSKGKEKIYKIIEKLKKEDLIEKAYVFRKFDIKEPTLLEILNSLKEKGIILDMKKFTINELVSKLKGKLKNEECN